MCALFACSAAPPRSPTVIAPPAAAHGKKLALAPTAPVDIIATLAAEPAQLASIMPGPAALELGGSSLPARDGTPDLDVDLLAQQGNDVRVGVRLDHVRFAMWTSRARLLGLLAHDQRIEGDFVIGMDPVEVVLRANAQVRRLAHEGSRTKVRYVGALEVEGWVPDDALVERGPADRTKLGRIPTGRKTLMVMPGAVIRAQPTWSARQLAVMNQGYFLDTIDQLDDGWVEVAYEDGDVRVHGFVSTQDPPARTHRRLPAEAAPPSFTPDATLADHTCLFVSGEPVGFIVGGEPADVEPSPRAGWLTLTIDTPWGPIAFEGRGATEASLATCGI